MACFRWKTACEDAPASRTIPSATKSRMPSVMRVFSKNAAPSPSAVISSSSCSIWSLSLTDNALGCSWQASRTVFMRRALLDFLLVSIGASTSALAIAPQADPG
jgi:hypothetical protein